MAEFCLECFNKFNKMNLTKKDVVITKYSDLCEGCGQWKQTIVKYKKLYQLKKHIHDLISRVQSS